MLIYIGMPAFFDALSVASHRATNPRRYKEKSADVFSRKYLQAVGLESLYSEIEPFIEWKERVKVQLRHHYAHRIPPYVPTALLTPEDQERNQQLGRDYRAALENQEFGELSEIMQEMRSLGSFCPLIHFFEDDSQMPLQSTVLNDLLTFQYVSLVIFEKLITLQGFDIEIV
ncbi:hypothetical protein [Celeribacter sp.]|uniref:hypothetical protein n=1 Tax=Celeribacter sp. TaxID=1890673 RepID=UPI003A92295E